MIVKPITGTKASSFLHDAKRFILSYRSIVDSSPLQLYSSALIFAPEESIIRNTFQNYIPGWISQQPKVDLDWNAVLQTLEGHSATDMTQLLWPSSVCWREPVVASQTLTVLSYDADASSFESCENATDMTA